MMLEAIFISWRGLFLYGIIINQYFMRLVEGFFFHLNKGEFYPIMFFNKDF
jgi:hypothetical protein